MEFPNEIVRVVDIEAPVAAVWSAISTADGLASWFGDGASIDLRPGGAARLTWSDGPSRELRVERVDEPTVLAFTWAVDGTPADDPRRTYVEFTLEPTPSGTRLRVVESGFAQLAEERRGAGYESHDEGWTRELSELVAYLAAS